MPEPVDDRLAWAGSRIRAIEDAVASVVLGQQAVVAEVVACAVAGGHALLEGSPGLGKTLLVRSLAGALGLEYGRIQFTPDLLPADVTGSPVLEEGPDGRRLVFRPGPLFANVVLADEINRATPRTQSALLEAMEEGAVTVGRERHALPSPFVVLATQNPIDMEGTFPLPEAQLDRFLAKVVVRAPDEATLADVLARGASGRRPPPAPVVAPSDVPVLLEAVAAVGIPPPLLGLVARMIRATDPSSPTATPAARRSVRLGASPRGGEAICRLARVRAAREGRGWVEAADIAAVALPALRHRVLASYEAEARGLAGDALVREVLHDLGELPPAVEAVLAAIERTSS